MPKNDRIRTDAGWVVGRKDCIVGICRLCGLPVEKGRRTFHAVCAEHWLMTSNPGHVRRRVLERDHAVCCRCGLDCDALERVIRVMRDRRSKHWTPLIGSFLRANRLDRHTWEAHHRLAVAEGGGGCELDNYETICIWCHKPETKALLKRLADKRKGAA